MARRKYQRIKTLANGWRRTERGWNDAEAKNNAAWDELTHALNRAIRAINSRSTEIPRALDEVKDAHSKAIKAKDDLWDPESVPPEILAGELAAEWTKWAEKTAEDVANVEKVGARVAAKVAAKVERERKEAEVTRMAEMAERAEADMLEADLADLAEMAEMAEWVEWAEAVEMVEMGEAAAAAAEAAETTAETTADMPPSSPDPLWSSHSQAPGSRKRTATPSANSSSESDTAPRPSADGVTAAPKRRRLRATRVCGRCRRLKLRCDRATPCASCVRSGLGDGCAYAAMGGLDAHDVHAKNGTTAAASAALAPAQAQSSSEPTPSPAPHAAAPNTAAAFQLPTPAADPHDEIAFLATQLPSPDDIRALLASFATFDLTFRLVPMAWFRLRVEDLLSRLPALKGDDTAFLALLSGVLLVGASARASVAAASSTTPDLAARASVSHLRHLHDRLMWHCTTYGPHTTDFAHAALIGCADAMTGPESSMARAWVAAGTARAALLLARAHVDHESETLVQREIRRRIWWQHFIANQFLADRLDLPPEINSVDVPHPLLIPDSALADGGGGALGTTPPADGVCEWAYVESKIGWAQVCDATRRILGSSESLSARLTSAHALTEGYFDALPTYMREPPKVPAWAHAQALITRIGVHDSLVRLYQPYFSISPATLDGVVDPLQRGIDAAVALVADIEALTQFLLFRWLEGGSTQMWTFGTRAFMAGMALSYALLAGRGGEAERAALDGALGALRLSASRGASHGNVKALEVLERVRALVVARAGDGDAPRDVGASVTDPYSGTDIAMPPDAPDLSAWNEWDALFHEFLRGDAFPVV